MTRVAGLEHRGECGVMTRVAGLGHLDVCGNTVVLVVKRENGSRRLESTCTLEMFQA